MLEKLVAYFAAMSTTEIIWVSVGLVAQLMFSARFLVQWIASEKARASVMPVTFWYFSLAGGLLLLAYAIYRVDPVFIMGQSFGVVVYSRNLYLLHKSGEIAKASD